MGYTSPGTAWLADFMSRVWQIAGGELGRRYDDLFLKHDVMFCGPGRFGPFDAAVYSKAAADGQITTGEYTRVSRFSEVRPGDVVLLRSGYTVLSMGIVAEGGYFHSTTFDDVFGWDLEHACRVIWQHDLNGELQTIQAERALFADRKQIPTFTAVADAKILDPLRSLLERCRERPLRPLPPAPPAPLSMEELANALFKRGLGFDAVDRVCAALEKQRRLIGWYQNSAMAGSRPTEHEVVAHIILPMLLALGWSEQLLAVEWHKIDLAVFNGTPTDASRCKLVCEAKSMEHGLQDDFQQAAGYVERHGLTECNKIVLANGGRFYLFRRHPGATWSAEPDGYLNVLKIREDHLLPAGTNAVDTLMALTPARIAE